MEITAIPVRKANTHVSRHGRVVAQRPERRSVKKRYQEDSSSSTTAADDIFGRGRPHKSRSRGAGTREVRDGEGGGGDCVLVDCFGFSFRTEGLVIKAPAPVGADLGVG